MLKKLNKWLLEHYPLAWNMRLPLVLAVLALFHLLHFIIGYSMYHPMEGMDRHKPGSVYFTTSFSLFSIIGSCVIFILWLARVFRNNAFKSFYPTSNNYLFLQFMMILLVATGNITCYYSYTYGYIIHARNNTSHTENKKDIRVFNAVSGLFQGYKDAYRIEKRCSPAPFPLSKRYDNNRSVSRSIDNNYYYVASNGTAFSIQQVDSMTGGNAFSYLNSCTNYTGIIPEGDQGSNSQKGLNVLLYQPEALKQSMEAFIQLCEKHHIAYELNAYDWFQWVYRPPYFPVDYTIYQKRSTSFQSLTADRENADKAEAEQANPKGYYVALQQLRSRLQNTQKAFTYHFGLGPFCACLYTALGISLLIFTFRATNRRIWMISLIGSALLCLIIGAFSAILSISGVKEYLLYFYLMMICSFYIIHLLSNNKTIAGLTLNWFAWSLPFVSVLLFGLNEGPSGKESWIEQHAEQYFLLCFVVFLFLMRLPLASRFRQWQAMPEN